MATGFIYIVTSVTKEYEQEAFCNVPTQWEERLYYGPCKEFMRPKVEQGDYILGISSSAVRPRRPRLVVFIAHVQEEPITFKEAYERFPALRGPCGPIHVWPVNHSDKKFPCCSYEHIPCSMHPGEKWKSDLASRNMDKFFVCAPRQGRVGRWLGKFGPEVDGDILEFLKECPVYGQTGKLSSKNKEATIKKPIVYKGQCRGLHLEANRPDELLKLCEARITASQEELDDVYIPRRLSSSEIKRLLTP